MTASAPGSALLCEDLSRGILGIGGQSQPKGSAVALTLTNQVFRRLGGSANQDHEDARRHRVKGSRMSHPFGTKQAADLTHYVVRGYAKVLIDDENTADLVHGAISFLTYRMISSKDRLGT